MCLSPERKKQVCAFGALFVVIAAAVGLLFYIDGRLFPTEASVRITENKEFLEWYRKALEAYQSATTLFIRRGPQAASWPATPLSRI
jgi:hypothetical protein